MESMLVPQGPNFAGAGGAGGVDEGAGVIVGEDFTAAFTATPLFQTSLVPDLTQVNFFPPVVDVAPALVHLAPALTAAKDGVAINTRERITESNTGSFLRTK
jgi:hypothetical protein